MKSLVKSGYVSIGGVRTSPLMPFQGSQPYLHQWMMGRTSEEAQIAHISSDDNTDISTLLQEDPNNVSSSDESFCELQLKDPALRLIMSYLSEGILPNDSQVAANIIVQASLYTMNNGLLYYVGQKSDNTPRVVVPSEYKKRLMEEYHSGIMSGHFSGPKIYKTMCHQWWWEHMYQDINDYARSCPQCAIVTGAGRRQSPQMKSIPVDHPFQIIGTGITSNHQGEQICYRISKSFYQMANGVCYTRSESSEASQAISRRDRSNVWSTRSIAR